MGVGKEAAHGVEEVKGGAGKTSGAATGSRRLEAEGRVEQAKGDARQAGADRLDRRGPDGALEDVRARAWRQLGPLRQERGPLRRERTSAP